MVRKAQESDYESIMNIRNSYIFNKDRTHDPVYLSRIQNEGFVTRPYMRTDFNSDLNGQFYVYEKDGIAVAYIRISSYIDLLFRLDKQNIWMNTAFKEQYYNDKNHCEIGSLLIAKEYQNTDILKQLLLYASQEVKKKGGKYLYSKAFYAPIPNTPMLLWHEKNGFEKICLTTPEIIYGIPDVQGILYVKTL